jgi:hypothetical protein
LELGSIFGNLGAIIISLACSITIESLRRGLARGISSIWWTLLRHEERKGELGGEPRDQELDIGVFLFNL